jgi:hypothetical protein
MSILNTLLAVDGSPAVLQVLAELGLTLPPTFRSRFAREDEVDRAVKQLPGHMLTPSDEPPGAPRFVRMLHKGKEPVGALQFVARPGTQAVLAGLRGDPCLALLRVLSREVGPLVVLLQAQSPIVIDR